MKKLIFASLVGACAMLAAPLPGPQATATPSSTKTAKKNMKHHKSKKAAKTTTPSK